MKARTPKELIAYAKEQGVQFFDLKFEDIPGLWQHFTTTWNEFDESIFENGIGFDGSSIRGFQAIHESDMLLYPDSNAAWMDPFAEHPTLSVICNVKDPITRENYSRDPRYIAQKAESYLKSTGIADTAYFGPEAEFFIFDDIRFGQSYNHGYYYVDSDEGFWNAGREEKPNLGYKPRYKEGYFPVPPMDTLQDIRSEITLTLEKIGVPVEVHHHEVATAGQCEIDMRFSTLTDMGDRLMIFKYVVKNVARKHGKTATFMPKPLFMDNGSGMHVHQSIWKEGKNLFYQAGSYADISQLCKYYIGGLLKHAHAILAFAAPTTNSYRRLVPGYEAPVNLAYSQRNRSACIRIPMISRSEKAKRLEFRCPDPSCNGYMAFAAMLMAGIDGIQNKIDPGDPLDKDIYDLEPEEAALVETVPGSLEESLSALEKDHDFLMKGDVFTEDLLEMWLSYKREREVDAIRLRPHPYEFALYFDI
jgi:glutamine synthetase